MRHDTAAGDVGAAAALLIEAKRRNDNPLAAEALLGAPSAINFRALCRLIDSDDTLDLAPIAAALDHWPPALRQLNNAMLRDWLPDPQDAHDPTEDGDGFNPTGWTSSGPTFDTDPIPPPRRSLTLARALDLTLLPGQGALLVEHLGDMIASLVSLRVEASEWLMLPSGSGGLYYPRSSQHVLEDLRGIIRRAPHLTALSVKLPSDCYGGRPEGLSMSWALWLVEHPIASLHLEVPSAQDSALGLLMAQMSSLRSLTIAINAGLTPPASKPARANKLGGESIAHTTLPLEVLDLRGVIHPDALAPLLSNPALDKLHTLRLTHSDLTLIDAAQQAHLPALTHLDLSDNPLGDDSVAQLCASPLITQLHALTLCAAQLTDRAALSLAAAPATRLERLELSRNGLSANGIHALAQSPSLTSLQLLRVNDDVIRRGDTPKGDAPASYEPRALRAGDRAYHKALGAGTIEEARNKVFTIRFDDAAAGVKRLNPNFLTFDGGLFDSGSPIAPLKKPPKQLDTLPQSNAKAHGPHIFDHLHSSLKQRKD
jgi:hypothetical protein